MVGISALWAGATEVALTDGALEVLNIAKENLLKNCADDKSTIDSIKYSFFFAHSKVPM